MRSGANYSHFTFQVQDDGGTANGGIDTDPTPRTMTVSITAANHAPVGKPAMVTDRNNTPYVIKEFIFGQWIRMIPQRIIFLGVIITTLPAMANEITEQRYGCESGPVHSGSADIAVGKSGGDAERLQPLDH